MPEFRAVSGGIAHSYGAVTGASSEAVQVTAAATANTKGAAVELTPATAFDASWIWIMATNASSSNRTFLVDLLAGTSPETVLIENLLVVDRAAGMGHTPYLFPLFIPRGTRLAARCQCSAASQSVRVSVGLVAAPARSPYSGRPRVIAYGADTSTSQGTLVDPGATANVDSAWTEITPATAGDHHWLAISGYFGDFALAAATQWRVQLGVGSAPEEVLATFHFAADTGADVPLASVVCFPCFLPRGTRIAARARSSSTTAGDRAARLIVWGA